MLDYAWLLLVFPALGTLVFALFGRKLGKRAVSILAPTMIALSFGVAVWIFITLLGMPPEERSHEVMLWSWMTTGGFHVYRLIIRGSDMSVEVDGTRRILGQNAFWKPASSFWERLMR